MVKKVWAYFIRLLGVFFILSIIGNIMGLLSGKLIGTSTVEKFEHLTALALAGLLAYLCFRYSNKLLRKKPKDEIDNIGKEGS
ncbi:hypothetical protein [Hyunsoonleella ulvae]|uniref:hypothetical protein n=1 Tax=Hyunsoonleella ulvae TaxID=2799948 RepID=UPI001939BB01|nr:hypothetical protein [Hyunsoonleella ulvae]